MTEQSVKATSSADLITFTDQAAEKLREVLAEEDTRDTYLRIIATFNGQGVQYEFGLDSEPGDGDSVVDAGTIKALVDEDSSALLDGSRIDYVDGLQRSGFVISNPNFPATGGCGCGGGGCGCGGGGAGAGHEPADAVNQRPETTAMGGGCGCGGGGAGAGHEPADAVNQRPETTAMGGGCGCGAGGAGAGHGPADAVNQHPETTAMGGGCGCGAGGAGAGH